MSTKIYHKLVRDCILEIIYNDYCTIDIRENAA